MSQHIDIDNFKGVVTHADLGDLPDAVATELKNFMPVNGKLVKTYDFNDIDAVCPIVVNDWTVINLYTYIASGLTDGYVYVAVLRDDSTGEVRVIWFVASLAPEENEPTKLVPFSGDSFWMQIGETQDYIDAGFALIMNTVFTSTESVENPPTHTFLPTSTWHKPNLVDGGNSTSVFGDIPTTEGMPYNMEEALHSSLNSEAIIITNQNDYGVDGHASFTGRVKDFSSKGDLSSYAQSIRAVKRFDGVTYCALTLKEGSSYCGGRSGDVIAYHDGDGWSIIDLSIAPFGYDLTPTAGSTVYITNFTVWGGRFYMGAVYNNAYHASQNPTGDGYNHDFWYMDFDTIGNSARLFNHVTGATLTYGAGISDVTTAVGTYSTEKLFVFHSQVARPISSTVGGLFYYMDASNITTGTANTLTLPTGLGARVWTSTCIYSATDTDFIHIAFNEESGGLPVAGSARTYALASTLPIWGIIPLPTSILGTERPSAPFTIDAVTHVKGYTFGGGDYKTYVMKITDSHASQDWYIVQYDGSTWLAPEKSNLNYTPVFMEAFLENERTGNNVIVSFSGSTNRLVMVAGKSATGGISIAVNGDSQPYTCFDSYEITDNHISIINGLYGIDDTSSGHPVLYKFLTMGANPAWGSWDSTMTFEYTADACVAWQMAVAGNMPTLYHKNAQNPIVLDNETLRLYAGAVAEIDGNESANIWIGYIDREFFFGEYVNGAGFNIDNNTPELPSTWIATDEGFTGVAGSGLAPLGGQTSYMFVPVFDGVQEALKNESAVRSIVSSLDQVLEVDLAIDMDDFPLRITAIKVYRSVDDLAWGLVKTINVSSKSTNQDYVVGGAGYVDSVLYVPNADFIADGVVEADDVYLGGGGSQGIASGGVHTDYIVLDATAGTNIWNGAWSVKDTAGTTVRASGEAGGYAGKDTVFNSAWDLGALKQTGWNCYISDNGSGLEVDAYVADGYGKMIQLYSNHSNYTNSARGAVTIGSLTNGYRFVEGADNAWTIKMFDGGLLEGASFPLDGAVSLKVNSDFATVLSNRMWQGRLILDVGGENEEQFNAVSYSELNQLDVTPVSNLIKLNDREGGGVTGIAELFGRPVVTMNQNVSIIDSKTYPADPTAWTISESVHNIGNIAKHGMVSALGKVYVIYHDGIYGLTSNNIAETDQTPTESLKISRDIEEVYHGITDKTAIKGEYNQMKNEIVWDFGSEVWAYSIVTGQWREVLTSTTPQFVTIDENADLMIFDSADGAIKTLEVDKSGVVGSASSTWRSKRYVFGLDRKSIVRQLSLYYASNDDLTINIYLDDNTGTPDGTYTVTKRTGEGVRHIPIKRYCKNFQVEIVTEDSPNSFELNKVTLEVEE